VGSAPAKGDVFSGYTKGTTSAKVDLGAHLNGAPIYVQIYSIFAESDLVPGTGAQFRLRTAPNR
jgi:hypothetical protein